MQQQLNAPHVIACMTNQHATPKPPHPSGGYIVRRPRPTDAIGQTLRSAYGGDEGLPCEIMSCLTALDRIECH